MSSTLAKTSHSISEDSDTHYRSALMLLTSLFFMWGFITCLNDILIPHLKSVFSLSYTQAMLIQFCFFGAYFLISLPAGWLIKSFGFQRGIVLGLLVAALGCGLFYFAAQWHSYGIFLTALFILASGITVLQVSANPYVSRLGKAETAPARLTLTQAFNSLGTTVAPFFGAYLILDQAVEATAASNAQAVQFPYLLLMSMLLVLAVIFAIKKLPTIEQGADVVQISEPHSKFVGVLAQHRHLRLGVMAIFVYVGAEVAIGSLLVSYLGLEHIAALPSAQAAHYIAYYWGGAMVGRFIGGIVMQKIAGGKVLAFNASMAVLLLFLTVFSQGKLAMWSVLLIGLCNSMMFPTIFALAINQLGKHTAQGSALLCLAIVGGALLPLLQGVMADAFGVQLSYLMPIVCYGFIAYFGLFGSKVQGAAK